MIAQRMDVRKTIKAPAGRGHLGRRAFTSQRDLAEISVRDPQKLCGFSRGKLPQDLFRAGRKEPHAECAQLAGECACIESDRFVDGVCHHIPMSRPESDECRYGNLRAIR